MGPIFHIGFHKTATSWFQRCVYPFLEGHRLIDRRRARQVLLDRDAFAFDPEKARAALGLDRPGLVPVICEEDLSGVLHIGLASGYIAREVARRLNQTAPNAQIVIFVRAQPEAALSWYQQYLREGGTRSVRRYLFGDSYQQPGRLRPFKLPHFSFDQLDYRGLIEHYDRLFGTRNVHVFPYERLTRDRDALLDEMAHRLGWPTLPDLADDRRVNAGYGVGLMTLARGMNLFTARSVADKRTLVHLPFWYPVRKGLLGALNRTGLFPRATPERVLGKAVVRWIHHYFWRSNRWLEGRMETDLRVLGYPLDPPRIEAEEPARSPLLRWVRN